MTPPLRISWLDTARFDIRKLDRPAAMRVFDTVLRFARSASGDLKPLHGEMTDSWRLRAGDYRVLFTIEGSTMYIFGVRHRSEAYR